MNKGRVIIISAPSGCGKSTIISALMNFDSLDLHFSVSATNRKPRVGEKHGVNYYFLETDRFKELIDKNEFVEWEEVYPGRFYGTLKREVERIVDCGHNLILDIDVKGGINVKNLLKDNALSIFIMPPSVDELRRRLEGRATDSADEIDRRVSKAETEIAYARQFDHIVINDNLDQAISQTRNLIADFIKLNQQ